MTTSVKNFSVVSSPGSTARAFVCSGAGNNTYLGKLSVANFSTGISVSTAGNNYMIEQCDFFDNGTAIQCNNTGLTIVSAVVYGSTAGTPANTGISISGASANVILTSVFARFCTTGLTVTTNAMVSVSNSSFALNNNDIIHTGGSRGVYNGVLFEFNILASDVDVQASGAGTDIEFLSCFFRGVDTAGIPTGTAVQVTDQAVARFNGGEVRDYVSAFEVGTPSDVQSTSLTLTSISVINSVTDIIQSGLSSLFIQGSSLAASKIFINDGTNVSAAFFDQDTGSTLHIGKFLDTDTTVLHVAINDGGVSVDDPNIQYTSSFYGTKGLGYETLLTSPSTWFTTAPNSTGFAAVTENRANLTSLKLISDTGTPLANPGIIRGWNVQKNGTSAELAFRYENQDAVGQALIAPYTVMQLDGVNNQLQLPTAATQIVFAGDTNLYRSAANTLRTDDTFVVGTLTPNRAVATGASSQLVSSSTTDTELGYLVGVTGPIQTQLDSKVSQSGDTMTGPLQLPAGSAAAPSLRFTGSTTSGLFASVGALGFTTNGVRRFNISSAGDLTVDQFTTAGVVHNNASGVLTSSLIVNADVDPAAAIVDTKLATIATAGKVLNSATTATNLNTPNAIVSRDASGNFSAGTITANLTGNVTGAASLNVLKAGDTMTGSLTLPAGLTTAPSLQFTGSTNTGVSAAVSNTLSLSTNGAERLSISPTGTVAINQFTTAGVVHNDASGNLSSSLIVNADVDPAAAIVDTKLATISTAGKVANSATTATNLNTANAIVSRDASGNFSAGTITANLTGNVTGAASLNVLKAGDTMTGTLVLPAGSTVAPSLQFTGSTNTGVSAASANTLSLSTNGAERLSISPTGTVAINQFTTAGVVHNDASGNLSSSLIVNADVDPAAAIVDTKLATISTAGKVANSATTATNLNTANAIVSRDASGNFSAGTITANLIGNVTGSASNNVLKSGDTMTGALILPAGSAITPSLRFTGSTNTGVSAPSANTLSLSTDGAGRLSISPTGIVTITGLNSAGVVHTNASGELSTSQIVDADIADGTITNAKLATISSTNTGGNIVVRDGSGNFDATMITLSGTTTNATDVATKAYVDSVVSGGLVPKAPAVVVSLTDVTISGLQTIDGVSLVALDRVLLVGQTNPIENGLWLVQAGAWTRPADFNTGDLAGQAYVLIEEGALYAGTSWICSTPNAVIDTDPIIFVQFGLADQTTAANVGAGAGQIFRNKTGVTLNLKTLAAGAFVTITNNANDIAIATNGTSANTPSTLVARDGSGNFSAGTITANLTGSASNNVLKAGDTMTGTLVLPAGSTVAPSLQFTGSTNTGVSAASANTLSLSTNGAERLSISPTGTVAINQFTTAGVVHNDASGNLSSSLIVNADVDPAAAIVDTKLATISTAGKVANSATTATNLNTANAIVSRDASGNFSAGTITANLTGNVTGAASLNVLKAGDTMTGTLILPAGSTVAPSLQFTGGTGTGVSSPIANTLSLSTNATERLSISPTGTVAINQFTTAGVVHNDASGNLSSSLIVNADVDPAAAIVDTKLATISTAGKVANSATTATNLNTANAIVSRDASGNFSAGTITANLIGNVTGSASNNVLKAGDTMTGTLNMALQNEIRFQDAAGGEYVGLRAPTAIAANYVLSLPTTAPVAGQVLSAGSITPTNLTWTSPGGTSAPSASRIIYVAKNGSDITGTGSFQEPYASVAQAVSLANTLATLTNPVVIDIAPGLYVENNSAGPITITTDGISVTGESFKSVIIIPADVTKTLFASNFSVRFSEITVDAVSGSTAAGFAFSGVDNASSLRNCLINNFAIGASLAGSSPTQQYVVDTCGFLNNAIGLQIDNVFAFLANTAIRGATSVPFGTGIVATGAAGKIQASSPVITFCSTGLNISNNVEFTASSAAFKFNTAGIVQSGGALSILQACSFQTADVTPTIIEMDISGAGTSASLSDCLFDGRLVSLANATALRVTNSATVVYTGGQIFNYTTGMHVGTPLDTAATILDASGVFVRQCTNDLVQQGASTVIFTAGSAATSTISINDPTNVSMALFDIEGNGVLEIGPLADQNIEIIHASNGSLEEPTIAYRPNFYGSQALGYINNSTSPALHLGLSNSSMTVAGITTNRTLPTSVRLVSDTASPAGTTTALRGWDIQKNGSSAELAFRYQNTDTTGQIAVPQYTVMQLDGLNNQVQLPTAATQLVFAADTNLYRSAANTLRTDDSLAVGTLTSNRAVATGASNILVSSTTTDTELGFLSGVTSSVQDQLNNRVLKAGDTMTGALQLPAGTTAAPSLRFTGSTTSGLSANAGAVTISTNALPRLGVSAGGTVSINGFTTAGVVHNDASGNLSTSLIVNADVDIAAGIVDTKLATISTAGKVANSATTATSSNVANTIVLRDASGNFSAGTITATLAGASSLNVLKAGDTMTGTLILPAGTAASPSLQFTGSTNTGLSAQTANTLAVSTNGTSRMTVSTTDISLLSRVIAAERVCLQSIQVATPTNGSTINANATTTVLFLTPAANVNNVTIVFPASPTNGQLFTILDATTNTISTITNNGNGASVVNPFASLNPTGNMQSNSGGVMVTYFYYAPTNSWYRYARG